MLFERQCLQYLESSENSRDEVLSQQWPDPVGQVLLTAMPPLGNVNWVECVGCDQVVDHEHCVQKLWVWALTLILKQNPDQQEVHIQAKHNETWVSWKRLHWKKIHSLVIFTDNLCSAQLGLSMWRFVFLFLAMQPRNSWAQGILLTCPPKQVGLQVHNATTSNVCMGQMNFLNYQV